MNLLFDFDGTICDSLEALLESANPAMRFLRKPELTSKDVREKGLIRILKENKIPRFVLPFIVVYVRRQLAKLIPDLKPFPQISKTIETLSKRHTLGIITSNSSLNVQTFLKNNNLDKHIDFVYSSVNFLDKSARINNALIKHNLNKNETYFIGDETRDMKAAKHSGVKTIAVTWGIESEKLLSNSKPYLIVRSPNDLLKHFS